ncbi:Tetraspanin [Dirofilaria immitis]|nr:Tetraspanin [Dirofilaria immitis]
MYKSNRYEDSVSWQSYRAVPSLSSVEQRNSEETSSISKASLRYIIYTCNIMIMVAGTASLAMGAWLRTDSRFRDFLSQRYRNIVEEAFWQAPTLYIFSYILFIVGMFMVVISMVGCCGASTDSRVLLILYAAAIEVEISDALTYMVQNYYQGAGIIQESLDQLQEAFRCCGNAGCSDFRFLHQDIPRSCDIRCDGCHYRIMVALRIGFSTAFVIFVIIVIAELISVASALILVTRPKSSARIWLDKIGYHRSHCGNNYYAPNQYIDLNSLRSEDCPVPYRHYSKQFT